jgi:protein-ribulosamine 3-kinase
VATHVGKTCVISEYNSIKIIHDTLPGFVPLPIAAGTYASDPNFHFLLLSYEDMSDDIPEPDQVCAKLAELHLKAISPNGMFGFPIDTGMGACIQPEIWTSSWEMCFTRLISITFQTEQDVHGTTDEMRELHKVMLEKVIPRLLRPLQTDGRSIKPCFVHGDLWDGNASVNMANEQTIVFDPIGFYAHNECKSKVADHGLEVC